MNVDTPVTQATLPTPEAFTTVFESVWAKFIEDEKAAGDEIKCVVQFIVDLHATEREALWPGEETPPPNVAWHAWLGAQMLFEAKPTGRDSAEYADDKMQSGDVKPTSQAKNTSGRQGTNASGRQGKKKKTKGRKKGSKNWTDAEMELMLDIVGSLLPSGHDQFERAADEHSKQAAAKGLMARDWEQIKNKFEKLAFAKKPTGNATPSPCITRAKKIREEIAAVEVIGFASLNDEEDVFSDDKSDSETSSRCNKSRHGGVEGTQLFDENGTPRRPAVYRHRAGSIAYALEQVGHKNKESAMLLGGKLDEFTTQVISKLQGDANPVDMVVGGVTEERFEELQSQVDVLQTQVESLETTMNKGFESVLALLSDKENVHPNMEPNASGTKHLLRSSNKNQNSEPKRQRSSAAKCGGHGHS